MGLTHASVADRLLEKITGEGIRLDHAGLMPYTNGADNLVFAARTVEGCHLIVKAPLRPGSRYETAAWAGRSLADHGIPVPQVIWCDDSISVESRCAGVPLTGSPERFDTSFSRPQSAVLHAARDAGVLLRIAHSISVHGYGRLTPSGTAPYSSLLASIQSGPETAARSGCLGELASSAVHIVSRNLWRLHDTGPRLLLGDCAARHIFFTPGNGAISGFIDLESARGGDPLADIAGFILREHAEISKALLSGYFANCPSLDQMWALTLHRARIATRLLLFHAGRNEHQMACRLADHLTADLQAINTETPTVLPRHLL
ncbi:Phosphotransferase enzyme family protein [Sinosporangium album]|uniref:Phosphotransferase enzyme family protein n=1 Tax=Sinosporangium album TaxID=504805 RepID=A0A1G8KZT1_9ACTN|nr:aminoglycoside phosphotransferase family protein [Sinosporangium album]SDI48390.1 Phosphotransferase enzyme family protein [Sinosporangium album]